MDFHSTSKVQIGVPSFSVACPLLLYVVIKVVVAFVVGRSSLAESSTTLVLFHSLESICSLPPRWSPVVAAAVSQSLSCPSLLLLPQLQC